MLGEFKLIKGSVHIGTFQIDSDSDSWEYRAILPASEQPLIFRLEMEDNNTDYISGEIVKAWIINRVPELNYHFIDALMEKVGMKEYDPLTFVAYNSGRFNTDNYYLTGPGMRNWKQDNSSPQI